jgi:hypothetical protein
LKADPGSGRLRRNLKTERLGAGGLPLKAEPGSGPGSNVAAAVFRFSESGAMHEGDASLLQSSSIGAQGRRREHARGPSHGSRAGWPRCRTSVRSEA